MFSTQPFPHNNTTNRRLRAKGCTGCVLFVLHGRARVIRDYLLLKIIILYGHCSVLAQVPIICTRRRPRFPRNFCFQRFTNAFRLYNISVGTHCELCLKMCSRDFRLQAVPSIQGGGRLRKILYCSYVRQEKCSSEKSKYKEI